MNLDSYDGSKPEVISAVDMWILSKLQKVIKIATESFDKYEYSKAKSETELFFWQIFCDNYLEIVKYRLYDESLQDSDVYKSAQYTLFTVVNTLLKLIAPFTPYITEEIYQLYFKTMNKNEDCSSIHISSWPKMDESMIDEYMEKTGDALVEIISAVRKVKSEAQASLKTPVSVLTIPENLKDTFASIEKDLAETTKALSIVYGVEFNVELDLSEKSDN